jgi:hypothetical protein
MISSVYTYSSIKTKGSCFYASELTNVHTFNLSFWKICQILLKKYTNIIVKNNLSVKKNCAVLILKVKDF